jgi:hypothetical protein
MADTNGLGYEGGAVVFAAGLVVVDAAYFYTKISHIAILGGVHSNATAWCNARGPAGQTVRSRRGGDQPYVASDILAAIIVALILILPANWRVRIRAIASGRRKLVSASISIRLSLYRHVEPFGGRTDLGEMAQLSAAESLNAVAGRELPDLFAATPDKAKAALGGLGTVKQFAVLARDFFARLSRRQLSYFLSRELSQHAGVNSRFHTIRDHRDFESALDLHCREASRIIKEFSGEWFSKHTHEGGIN